MFKVISEIAQFAIVVADSKQIAGIGRKNDAHEFDRSRFGGDGVQRRLHSPVAKLSEGLLLQHNIAGDDVEQQQREVCVITGQNFAIRRQLALHARFFHC